MLSPQQLAPTVGPAHDGFKFLKGSFPGIKGYAVGRMTKSHRGKLYIDKAGWGPKAGSIEYGYRVPFGGIHVFIGKIGESGPEPDTYTDIIETAQRARPTKVQAVKHAFVGFIHGADLEEGSVSRGETVIVSDGVGDITTGVTRPGGAGLRHDDHHMMPNIKLEDGGSVMGLRPVVINHR